MTHQVSSFDKNILTFTLSALLISALVLGVVFTLEDFDNIDSMPSLDVILSKQKSINTPEKADYLAQNDQQGGGESEKNVRPQNIKTGISADDQGNHMQEQVENRPNMQEQKDTELITSEKANLLVKSAAESPDIDNTQNDNELLTQNQKLAKLENNISNRLEAYAKKTQI